MTSRKRPREAVPAAVQHEAPRPAVATSVSVQHEAPRPAVATSVSVQFEAPRPAVATSVSVQFEAPRPVVTSVVAHASPGSATGGPQAIVANAIAEPVPTDVRGAHARAAFEQLYLCSKCAQTGSIARAWLRSTAWQGAVLCPVCQTQMAEIAPPHR